jgi:hypothetical protein
MPMHAEKDDGGMELDSNPGIHKHKKLTVNLMMIMIIMKFSRFISQVRWFSFVETNISKTISVLILRVVEIIWVRWTTQSFYLYLSKTIEKYN